MCVCVCVCVCVLVLELACVSCLHGDWNVLGLCIVAEKKDLGPLTLLDSRLLGASKVLQVWVMLKSSIIVS